MRCFVAALLALPACASGTVTLGSDPYQTDVDADADTDVDADADTDTDTDGDADTDADADTEPDDPDGDRDGHPDSEDCDDSDAEVFPGAEEVCDGADQDCDGGVDEEAADAPVWYRDADGDGFGDSTTAEHACEAPAGFVAEGTDCNDLAAAVAPGTSELCNLVDDDCNGAVDDEPIDAPTYYPDADGDRHGDAGAPLASCTVPAGYVVDGSDCYDGNASVYPGASGWLSTDRGDGSYDADCDGVETQRYTHVSTTGIWGSCCWDPGWVTSIPACGADANWIDASGNQPLVRQECQ